MLNETAVWQWGAELPTLPSSRLALRGLGTADIPDLFAVFSDPEVMRYWSCLPFQHEKQAAELLRAIHEGFRSRSLFQWGIEHRETRRIIGTCTLLHFSWPHRRAELGYALNRSYWGQGFATEMLRSVIGFAFDSLNLHRLEADVDPRNERSLRALARQGFRQEGILRQRYHLAGETPDAIILGLLRPEWTGNDLPS